MGVSDIELDKISAALDRGDMVDAGVVRDLADEVRASRVSLELASKAVGLIGQAATEQARLAKSLVEHYRNTGGMESLSPVITMDWPGGFTSPEVTYE